MMRALEEAVLETERALDSPSNDLAYLMAEHVDDITVSAKPAIRAKLREIRTGIREMKERYGLRAQSLSTRRQLLARLSVVAVELAECTPGRLRGLGEVPKGQHEPLDELISRLEKMVNDLKRLIRGDA